MWELDCEESWALKNWWFWSVVLEKTLESPLDCKEIQPVHSKGDQSWVFIGRTDAKLKLQYFGYLMQRVDSLVKTLMLGGIGGRRRKGHQRMRWLDGITDSMDVGLVDSGSWWWTGRPGVLRFMGSQRVGHDSVTELNWIDAPLLPRFILFNYNFTDFLGQRIFVTEIMGQILFLKWFLEYTIFYPSQCSVIMLKIQNVFSTFIIYFYITF